LGPPAREQDPKQWIPKAKAGATSSTALDHGDLMAQGDRFQQQRGAGSGFAWGDRHRSTYLNRHDAGCRQATETTYEFVWVSSIEEGPEVD
jgi:hypothetical protein